MAKEIVAILLLVMLALPATAQSSRPLPVVHIAIVTDGPSARAAPLRDLFLQEIRAVNRGEFDIQAPADLQLEADRTLAGVRAVLDRVLADPRTDLVVTLGVLGSHAAAQRASLPKPVVAPLVTNHGLQELPYKDGVSGKRNLNYVSLDVDIQRDLMALRKIVPFERLALLLDGAISEAIPGVQAEVARVARELGITVTPVAVADTAAAALAAIPKDTQAVYVGPMPRLSPDEYQRLVAGLIERRLPSFAFEGKSDVERGLLLATIARSMPQFALLMILVVVPLNMLSGSSAPPESMPPAVQAVMLAAPTTHFVSLAQAILFRGAGLEVVWPQLLAIVIIGAAFFLTALVRFRRNIALA